jgi:hypothetical protein
VCFGDALHFDDVGTVRSSSLAGTLVEHIKFHKQEDDLRLMMGWPYHSLLNGNYISLSSAVVSKKALERVRGFDPTIRSAEDRDLFLRLSRIGRFAYYPRVGSQEAALRKPHAPQASNVQPALSPDRSPKDARSC